MGGISISPFDEVNRSLVLSHDRFFNASKNRLCGIFLARLLFNNESSLSNLRPQSSVLVFSLNHNDDPLLSLKRCQRMKIQILFLLRISVSIPHSQDPFKTFQKSRNVENFRCRDLKKSRSPPHQQQQRERGELLCVEMRKMFSTEFLYAEREKRRREEEKTRHHLIMLMKSFLASPRSFFNHQR